MERIRKESDLPRKSGGHRASNKNIRTSSYRKGHQLYILLSFNSVRALEIHDVARATSCIACALEMRSSNGRERPQREPPLLSKNYFKLQDMIFAITLVLYFFFQKSVYSGEKTNFRIGYFCFQISWAPPS